MIKRPTKITLIGHICIDHNIVNGESYINWGSAVMYMAHYFKEKLGVTTQIIAPYGKDFQQHSESVNIINPPDSSETLIYKNIIEGEKRVQYCYGSAAAVPVKINAELKNILKETDILFIAPLIANYNYDYVAELMSYTPDGCLKVLLPQGYMRQVDEGGLVSEVSFIDAEKVVPLFDIAIMSDEDCSNAFGVARNWASYNSNLKVIVTENRKGATVFEKGSRRHISTKPVATKDIVNSVGSGDVFSAQMAYSLYQQGDVGVAASSANKATREKLLG